MNYPTVNHHVPEISSLANLPTSTNQHFFTDVFQSPCPGSQFQSSYVPENLRSPSIIVLDDDSIHRNPALNSYKKKIFSPATFFSHTPGILNIILINFFFFLHMLKNLENVSVIIVNNIYLMRI